MQSRGLNSRTGKPIGQRAFSYKHVFTHLKYCLLLKNLADDFHSKPMGVISTDEGNPRRQKISGCYIKLFSTHFKYFYKL